MAGKKDKKTTTSKAGMPSNVPEADIGEDKIDTLAPKKEKSLAQTILGDINKAVTATSAGSPSAQLVQESLKTQNALAEAGYDPKLAKAGYNAPVHPDQVDDYIENPLTFDPNKQAPERVETTTKTADSSAGNTVNIANGNTANGANAYNVGEKDVDSIGQSGLDEYKVAKQILDDNNPYKSGADYVKYLWSQGAGGKAKAIGNVLGNVLGNAGQMRWGGGDVQDTQWNDYVNEYQRQDREARETAMQDAQNAVKTANANQAARTEMAKALKQAKAQGANITEQEMAAINMWQAATAPSSSLEKAIASILVKVGDVIPGVK